MFIYLFQLIKKYYNLLYSKCYYIFMLQYFNVFIFYLLYILKCSLFFISFLFKMYYICSSL